jgi:sugar phosphate isomerase/epimerase
MSTGVTFGICTAPPGTELARALSGAGCDYYEPAVASAIMAEGRDDFDASLARWGEGGLRPASANVFLPGDLKVVGPDVEPAAVQAYMDEALQRAKILGVKRIVFGSGKSREIPEGFPRQEAELQLRQAARWASDAAEHAGDGAVICLEHLRRAETNIMNSLAEAGRTAADVDRANVGLVVDIYHLLEEDEDFGVVREVADKVAHVHVCGPDRHPPAASDEANLTKLFGLLAGIGYQGRVSIEASFSDLAAQAPAALAVVRHAAEVAGLA